MINVENLCVSFEGREILKDVSFSVRDGEYVCIVGENGSGKSTLVRALLKTIPSKGKIELPKNKRIGYLPQQSGIDNKFPATVYEVVISGRLNKKGMVPFYNKEDRAEAKEAMQRLGIEKMQKQSFGVLSGGQKQRVLLARALCACDGVLILDEPVTGLDPVVTKELYAIIRKLNKEKNITVLMVSHDISAACENADKILHIGKTVKFYGTVEDYVKSDIGFHFTGRCCHND